MTAVEWLINELDLDNNPWNMKIINKAKEMEKQQIIDAHGIKTKSINQDQSKIITGSQYYDETFNK
jgi:hypothetical protein